MGDNDVERRPDSFLNKFWHPTPRPPAFGKGKTIPQASAGPWSRLVLSWLSPLITVGFTRPLEKDDLWELDDRRRARVVTDRLESNFYARCPPEKRPARFRRSATTTTTANDKNATDAIDDSTVDDNDEKGLEMLENGGGGASPDRKKDAKKVEGKGRGGPRYDSSLPFALQRTFFFQFWLSGILYATGEALATTSPLITRALLQFLVDAYAHHNAPALFPDAPPIGKGIGLAFGLFAMQELGSLCRNQAQQYGMQVGLLTRGAVIGNVFRKSLRLSGRARLEHNAGKITTMISTDATRLDFATTTVHMLWISPIMIFVGIGLLVNNMGPSGLVAFGALVVGFPLQGIMVKLMINQRFKGVKITDSRSRLTQEVLGGIRLIKIYAWEMFYMDKIGVIREAELKTVKRIAIARSGLYSSVTFVPIAAAILSFITYALTKHDLNPAIIFSSLQLMNVIRLPLVMIPMVFSMCSDAYVSLGRIGEFLLAEEQEDPFAIKEDAEYAVNVEGDFTWEVVDPNKAANTKGVVGNATSAKEIMAQAKEATRKDRKDKVPDKKGAKTKNGTDTPVASGSGAANSGAVTPTVQEEEKDHSKPFTLEGLDLKVPPGSFVAISGRIGSGKSSVLNALIGEMRRTKGEVVFNGSVAYCPQSAWIMNGTLRDNVLFGSELDEARLQEVYKACSLEHDIEMLPSGELTEIGERGINVSGGQKARISLARAAYSNSDIVLLDDPLSAVDAHVGKAIMENCLLSGPLSHRTRVLVTHSLSALPYVDYIYVLDSGRIVEQGNYTDLITSGETFSALVAEFGGTSVEEATGATNSKAKEEVKQVAKQAIAASKPLMQEEDRNMGQMDWGIYRMYLKAAGGFTWALIILGGLLLTEAANVVTNLFLGWWTSNSIKHFTQSDYMGLYSGIGLAQALIVFINVFSFSLAAIRASKLLYRNALTSLLRSPVSFFDTTPIGRIMSRMSRDVESLDNTLPNSIYQFLRMATAVIGAVFLIFYTFPYLGIAIPFLFILYYLASTFYRRTSVEVKRLDSVLRSHLYACLSETLSGLNTVRAWRAQPRFIQTAETAIDSQNRAYLVLVLLQRWLGVRLDFLANLLVLGIALIAVGLRSTTDPSKTGVVLTYTLAITSTLTELIAAYARSEQELNAVERLQNYGNLKGEAPPTTKDDPEPRWPKNGAITFKDVSMAYRPGLPNVLHTISFEVKAGEKVGIVGRTGAGKSSLLQCLFRLVEIEEGTVEIDGIDTRTIGLDTLRHRLAVIPQDSLLFQGTIRQNIDPQGTRTDAELISALQRAWLLPKDGKEDKVSEAKFSLESVVSEEGGNFSAGERQLVALCRALVKDTRIIVMDEATSNVDVETDSKVQTTTTTEFKDRTLLCIAHRLNTIVYYDRVLVLDAGRVAEYDTPLALFDKGDSIFRSLCRESGLNRADIVRIRSAAGVAGEE